MAKFGETLRRERELRNVSLEEISASTKISRRFLSAIESEEFDKLPGGVFNRGFVRAFAQYLGLDEEKLVAEYGLAAGEAETPPPRTVPRATVSTSYTRPILLTVLLLAVAAAGVYTVYGRRALPLPTVPATVSPPPAAAPTTLAPAPAAVEPSVTTNTTAEPAGTSAPTPPAPTVAEPQLATTPAPIEGEAVRLRLQVDVIEPSWVSVTADGRRVFARTLQPRETRTITASRVIQLKTGNASAVVLTLNGETLAPLGKPGETKSLTLTEKDLKPATP